MEYLAEKMPAIHKVLRTRVTNSEIGPTIYMEVSVIYGNNVKSSLKEFKERAIKEIEKLTAMNVVSLEVVAKNIYIPEKEEGKE